jgi:hypothetical protein
MGIITKGMGAILKKAKPKSKSNFIKDKAGTIVGVKPGSGKVPWYIGASGKDLKKRAETVKTWSKVKTIDKINAAEKKIKEGTKELKHLRQTGWTKRIGKGRKKHYFPKAK